MVCLSGELGLLDDVVVHLHAQSHGSGADERILSLSMYPLRDWVTCIDGCVRDVVILGATQNPFVSRRQRTREIVLIINTIDKMLRVIIESNCVLCLLEI